MSVARFRVGFIITFVIAIIFVGLGGYSVYYFFTIENVRSTYLFGGLGIAAFGCLLIKATCPIFVPIKKVVASVGSCPYCGSLLREDVTVCEKCKQPITDNK